VSFVSNLWSPYDDDEKDDNVGCHFPENYGNGIIMNTSSTIMMNLTESGNIIKNPLNWKYEENHT
jgi:hypothetical protein